VIAPLASDRNQEMNECTRAIQTEVGLELVSHCCITSSASTMSSCRSLLLVFGLVTIENIAAMNSAVLVHIHPLHSPQLGCIADL